MEEAVREGSDECIGTIFQNLDKAVTSGQEKKGMTRKAVGSLLALSTLLGMTLAAQAAPQPTMTHHLREAVRSGQSPCVGRLDESQSLRLDIVLALRHQPELENFLQELYDPSSPSYRQFVTVQEFTERFGPSQEDYDAVLGFAAANGLDVVGGSRDAMDIQVSGSVATIEKALHVIMGIYQHPAENRIFYAPDREPTIDLPFQLWHVSGLDNYSIPRPLAHRNSNLQVESNVKGSCPDNSYCGSDMRAAYYGQTALTGAGQTLGLLEYEGYDIADLKTYFKNVGQTNAVPVDGISTDGTSLSCLAKNKCDDREQIIDMTQAISMAPGLDALYVYVGSTDTAILGSMSTHKPLNAQVSSSWTWEPSDPSTDDPYFQKFAAQGQNYFQASGDDGAFKPSSTYVYPADDAYVTSVGGTDLQTQSAGGPWASETAWSESGGGYYTKGAIPIPSWQQLAGVITASNEGSKTLRNSPDVAAEANYDFYTCADQEACQTGWGGTSFAAPMWAGYLALVNQQAVADGFPVLGFINPAIYSLGVSSNYATAFHDITSGSNGYPAVAGYDLVTGWGSPNGTGLINAFLLAAQPAATLSTATAKWGAVTVGKTVGPQTVTVTNTGSETLTISNIAITGDFWLRTIKTSCGIGTNLAVGGSCVLKVMFTPTTTGPRTGTLTITDNAPNSPQLITLSGTGK